MPDVILNLRFIGAALFVVAAVLLVVFRLRQVKNSGNEIKSRKSDLKAEQERRCPHFREKEIKAATKTYVRPDCAQVDPADEAEFRKFASVREPIFTSVKRYIDNESRRHLLILADSGMGKTTFCLNFFHFMKSQYPKHDVALASLARSDAEKVILNIPSKRTTTLILDAFDEDPKAITQGADRLTDIMDMCADFPLVLVTCRSHFFENDSSIPLRTGLSRIVPRTAGRTSSYEFARLYLLPFDEQQIDQFLRKSFPFLSIYSWKFRKKARELISTIPDLSARPMLLALVPELVRSGQEPKEIYELYDYMVSQWLLREERWVPSDILYAASLEIAFYLSEMKQRTGNDRLPPESVQNLGLTSEKLEWKHLTTRSLLNRDSEGNLKFAHRSIMEFLVVKGCIAGDSRAAELVWTDFMREILLSYGFLNPSDKKVLGLVDELFKQREITKFPYSDQIPLPMLRTKSEFDAFANPGRNTLISRHVFPKRWIDKSVRISKTTGYTIVNDLNNGLSWRCFDVSDTDFYAQIELFKVPLHLVGKELAADGYSLPSFPEILTLLRIQIAQKHEDFISPRHFYWLGDKSDRGTKMMFSLENSLDHPAATQIVSHVRMDGKTLSFHLFAIDPYRDTTKFTTPSAMEIKVKRREQSLVEIQFV